MKTFTARQLSRTPANIFDAAREDGKVEITHDRYKGQFHLYYKKNTLTCDASNELIISFIAKSGLMCSDIDAALNEKAPEGADPK